LTGRRERERGEKREEGGGGGIKTGDEFLPRAGIFKQSMGARNPPGYIGWRNSFLGIDSWAP